MKAKSGKNIFFTVGRKIIVFLSLILVTGIGQAATVDYVLENVIQDNGRQLTGSFQWTYDVGDFENGSGIFSDLYIPGFGSDIGALTINFDIRNSIEFTFTDNIDNGGVTVTLFLQNALTPSQAATLDLNRSAYEIEVGGQRGGFVSGAVVPVAAVPVPAAAWLFASGLLGLVSIRRYRLNG